MVVAVQLVVAVLAHAQKPGKIFRIGFVENSTASSIADQLEAFRQELRKLGWIEGKNIAIESRVIIDTFSPKLRRLFQPLALAFKSHHEIFLFRNGLSVPGSNTAIGIALANTKKGVAELGAQSRFWEPPSDNRSASAY